MADLSIVDSQPLAPAGALSIAKSEPLSDPSAGDIVKAAAGGFFRALNPMNVAGAIAHPVDQAAAIWKMGEQQRQDAKDAYDKGDYAKALERAVPGYVPLLGPLSDTLLHDPDALKSADAAGQLLAMKAAPKIVGGVLKGGVGAVRIARAAAAVDPELASLAGKIGTDAVGAIFPQAAHAIGVVKNASKFAGRVGELADRLNAQKPAAAPPTPPAAAVTPAPQPSPVNPYFTGGSTNAMGGVAARGAAGEAALARTVPAEAAMAGVRSQESGVRIAPAPTEAPAVSTGQQPPATATPPPPDSFEGKYAAHLADVKAHMGSDIADATAAKDAKFADYLANPPEGVTFRGKAALTGDDVAKMSLQDYRDIHAEVPTGKVSKASGKPTRFTANADDAALEVRKQALANMMRWREAAAADAAARPAAYAGGTTAAQQAEDVFQANKGALALKAARDLRDALK